MILAPLRGVTIRCFRETFAAQIAEAGFTEAFTPFITANHGVDPLKDREVRGLRPADSPRTAHLTTVQFIGKDPAALRFALERIKAAGFATADLNCGCPFPMVRNKGRGSGILRTPDVLRQMLDVGCAVMGDGRFSIKARLGVDRKDELLGLMPLINCFPLRFITVHARTARQMYEGDIDMEAFEAVRRIAAMPVVYNGDAEMDAPVRADGLMVGRAFIRWLGRREDILELLERYISASFAELGSERPVVGRVKELVAYWQKLPNWSKKWQILKLSRSLSELRIALA